MQVSSALAGAMLSKKTEALRSDIDRRRKMIVIIGYTPGCMPTIFLIVSPFSIVEESASRDVELV